MKGPFPGMDPWLEESAVWPGVHASLIIYIRDYLQPLLRPNYIAAVDERVFVTSVCREIIPDVLIRPRSTEPSPRATAVLEPPASPADIDDAVILEVVDHEFHEPFIQILDRRHQTEIITVIEILRPTNKLSGPGRDQYLAKQRQVLSSTANLVEIDLLRAGPFSLGVPESHLQELGTYDYLVAATRGRDRRFRSFFYPRFVRDRLPRIDLPLRADDAGRPLDLQAILDRAYEAGDYASSIDYSKPCYPRLRPDDEAWAAQRVAAWRQSIKT